MSHRDLLIGGADVGRSDLDRRRFNRLCKRKSGSCVTPAGSAGHSRGRDENQRRTAEKSELLHQCLLPAFYYPLLREELRFGFTGAGVSSSAAATRFGAVSR